MAKTAPKQKYNMTRKTLLENAILNMSDMGINPVYYARELGTTQAFVKKVLHTAMLNEAVTPQKPVSTWMSKTVATIVVLAAMNFGGATIARMLKRRPPTNSDIAAVEKVIEKNAKQIEKIRASGVEKRDGSVKFPMSTTAKTSDTQDCVTLARIIFAEAANQPLAAKEGVAQVVLNRVSSPQYPDTVDGVVKQRAQFTGYMGRLWKISGNPSKMNASETKAYDQCLDVARRALDGTMPNRVGGATLYHDHTISMPWNEDRVQHVTDIGFFSFYNEVVVR